MRIYQSVHDVIEIKVNPAERLGDRETYTQDIELQCEDGSSATFTAFFTDAVSKVKAKEAEAAEREAAQEQAEEQDICAIMDRWHSEQWNQVQV